MLAESWRRWAAVAIVTAPVLVTVPWVLSLRDRLPAELATHWTVGPNPDQFTGRDAFLDGWAVFSIAALALGVLITVLLRRASRTAVTITGAVTGFLAALGLMIALPNLDLSDPQSARVGWEAALPLALMAAVAGLAWWAHGRPTTAVQPATEPPPADLPRLGAGEAAHYDETDVQWWLAGVVLALLGALGVAMWVLISPWLGAELVLLGVVLSLLARTSVRVSPDHGLALSGGFVTHRVPITEITGARPREHVSPFAEFGGWGLRYRPRAVGLVQRAGPGVEVGRTGDRRVVITTDEPQRLAAVINTLADQQFPLTTS